MKNAINDSILAGLVTAGVGESISGGEITGNPQQDIPLKIVLPVITGLLIPFVKGLLDDYRQYLKSKRAAKLARLNSPKIEIEK